MSLNERIRIQSGLERSESFKSIARAIGKDCTTVSREIRNHYVVERTGGRGRKYNDCARKGSCREMNLSCQHRDSCNKKGCRDCHRFCMTPECKAYVAEKCVKLMKSPYVCNGCPGKPNCNLEKHVYRADRADVEYKDVLSETWAGFAISEEEVRELTPVLYDGIVKKKQSLYHIIQTVGEDVIGYSAKTLYTYINAGVFEGIGNIDLINKVKYKPRRKNPVQAVKKDKSCRIGRTYKDYQAFMEANPDVPVVQMDTVEGKKGIGEKCLLTIHFPATRLMLAFIGDSNSAASVAEVFRSLRDRLGTDTFVELFPVILTDNGSEFSDPDSIEMEDPFSGEILTQVFYCDPRQSQQKGACENNHEFIRRVIPKGKSMNRYTQEQIDLMMSHINSYSRGQLGGKSPYDVFAYLYGVDILTKLNIRRVPPEDVSLTTSLLD